MVSKKKYMNWIASGLRAGVGMKAVDVEVVAVAGGALGGSTFIGGRFIGYENQLAGYVGH